MTGPSAIDSLRRLSPVSDTSAAAVFGDAGREELLAGVTSFPLSRRSAGSRGTRRRRPLVFALAVLLLLGTAAAAWAIFRSPAQETTGVECVIEGTDTIVPAVSGDPAHDCAVTWKRDTGTSAPPLRAYDNGHGGVTVLPRSETPPTGYKRMVSGQDVALIQLQDSLDDYVNGLNSGCLSSTAATSLTKAELAKFGFTGWTVTTKNADASEAAPQTETGSGKKAPTAQAGSRRCWNIDVVDPSTLSVTLMPATVPSGLSETNFERLAAKLRPLTQSCESLPAAATAVRAAANGLGLSESAKTYELNVVRDDSLRCASIDETVGGTIFLTVRGPKR
jgi:hypothetical protein